MTLYTEIQEERYGSGYNILAKDEKIGFKSTLKIPKEKVKNKRYLKKCKKSINGLYEQYKELYQIFENIEGKTLDIEQKPYLLCRYDRIKRFKMEEELNLVVILTQENEKPPYLLVGYEKYNPNCTWWDIVEITRFTTNKKTDVKEKIEELFKNEWQLKENQEYITHSIKEVFRLNQFEVKENRKTYYIYETEKKGKSRTLFRIKANNKDIAILLKNDLKNHSVLIGYEKMKAGYRNVIEFKDWLEVPFENIKEIEERVNYFLRLDLQKGKMKEIEKEEEKSFLQKLFQFKTNNENLV